MAPVPARNVIQGALAPSASPPASAPIASWATVPTTISESAVEIFSQFATRTATSASKSQRAATNHT